MRRGSFSNAVFLVAFSLAPLASSRGALAASAEEPRDGAAARAVDLTDAASWRAMPLWLANPSPEHSVRPLRERERSGLSFRVALAGCGMKWRRALEEPVDTATRRFLSVTYRARRAGPGGDYFLWIADEHGGVLGREDRIIGFEALEDDTAWHEITVEVPGARVTTLALQVQAARAGAAIDVARIAFSRKRPGRRPGVLAGARPGRFEGSAFLPCPLEPNAPAGAWLERLGLEGGWPRDPVVEVEGVPFRLARGEPRLLATALETFDEVRVEVGREAGAIWLLLAADLTGEESPSIGRGPLRRVRRPERLCARIEYDGGPADLIFPERLSTGAHAIGVELAVQLLVLPRRRFVRRLVLVDRMRQGRLLLAAATVGPRAPDQPGGAKAGRGGPRVAERAGLEGGRGPRPPSRVAAEAWPPGTVRAASLALLPGARAGEAGDLVDPRTGISWLARPTPLYAIEGDEGVGGELRSRALPGGELELELELVNEAAAARRVAPVFPLLRGLGPGGDPAELGYCFPRRGAVISRDRARLEARYGGLFPLQFIDVFHPEAGGLSVATRDRVGVPRSYRIEKRDRVDIEVRYEPRRLEPGERWRLPPAVLFAHEGDWHAALSAYRGWLESWRRPVAPVKREFREVFNFRQQFLHFSLPRPSGAFDERTKRLAIPEVLAADAAAFGGADWLHLFDWGWTPAGGRCGDYQPWEYLGGVEPFRRQVEKVQAAGVPVGLYVEGYLVDPPSQIGKAHGKEWQLLREDGTPYTNFAPSYHLCPRVGAWQEYLAGTYARVVRETGARGVYLDELGFASSYICYAPRHGHEVPAWPLVGERELTRRVREALPGEVAIYTEETPADVTTPFQDGSFTYALSQLLEPLSPAPLNLTRFALPEFKTVEIIVCDRPLRDDEQAVRRVFFNGEAIWLEGVAEEWFTAEVRQLIARTHRVLRAHRAAFTSLDPEPLVPTLRPDVFANRFPADAETVWTLYNAGYATCRGPLLEVEHRAGMRYRDAWNERELEPRVSGARARISLEIGPRDVGCVVASRADGEERRSRP